MHEDLQLYDSFARLLRCLQRLISLLKSLSILYNTTIQMLQFQNRIECSRLSYERAHELEFGEIENSSKGKGEVLRNLLEHFCNGHIS